MEEMSAQILKPEYYDHYFKQILEMFDRLGEYFYNTRGTIYRNFDADFYNLVNMHGDPNG